MFTLNRVHHFASCIIIIKVLSSFLKPLEAFFLHLALEYSIIY